MGLGQPRLLGRVSVVLVLVVLLVVLAPAACLHDFVLPMTSQEAGVDVS